jgi:hypothetical protein
MNRALLAELQRLQAYPSVTILMPTTPGRTSTDEMRPDEFDQLVHLADLADRRLDGDVPDEQRRDLVRTISDLVERSRTERPTRAIAICVSPQHASVVRLGREVRSRVVIDDTFATRDMVADANRTAVYRVITVSDRKARTLLGDRQRLVEERNDQWPLLREEGQSLAAWSRAVAHAVRSEHVAHPLPTVVAGVDRSVREILKGAHVDHVGVVPGNHDRTGWADLHTMAWPLVSDWLRSDARRALHRLERAVGEQRFAGGIAEVWDLAQEGRVQMVVVENGFEFPARVADGRLVPAADVFAPDVIDDAVDELIETVLRKGGTAVIVDDGQLSDHDHLAAVLRY